MNVLSLFDGISCGRVALDRAGINYSQYYASEVDKNAIAVAQKNYPNTIHLGDVKDISAGDLPKIDLLIGGSPCQGFSIAGKGLNFDDPRSALFFEFVRLKNEINPRYWMLENVPMKAEYLQIISEMVGAGGYMIDSMTFSAQKRKRYYWTNIQLQLLPAASTLIVEDILEEEVDDKYYVNPQRAVKILDNEVARRKIAYIGSDSQANRIYSIHGKAVTLAANGGGMGAKMGLYAMPCLTPDRAEKRQNGRRFKPPGSKFYTLTAQDRHGILTGNYIRRLTPVECERLQTLPDGYTDAGISDNQRYKMLGNAWTADVIAHIFKGIEE